MYRLLVADEKGNFTDHKLGAAGRSGSRFVELMDEDMVELPAGASLVSIPEGQPVGLDHRGRFKLAGGAGGTSQAVAALLPQGYTRTLLPAYWREPSARPLPLFGYAAVAARAGRLYAAARRTDLPERWDPVYYNTPDLPALVRQGLAALPANRIIRHLGHCALEYQCFTAQNIFYRRWEGGLPSSPGCNARCLGCISRQPAECCPSPQERIDFQPTVSEITELAVHHLSSGPESIISFGQGCEGEPALAAAAIAPAIAEIRRQTGQGTINMNSNGGYTEGVAAICRAGLDSIRVSIISAREEIYNAYYRPKDYSLADVYRSVQTAKAQGVYVSLNYLVLPGLNDRPGEIEAMLDFIRTTGVDLVQMRNLNIDPDWLFQQLPVNGEAPVGIPELISVLQQSLPGVAVGNFSKPVHKS